MKTRSVVVFSSSYEVFIREQVSLRSASPKIRLGQQVSLWSSAREKLGNRNRKHICRVEVGEQSSLSTPRILCKKIKRKIEKPSVSVNQKLYDSGDESLFDMMICSATSPVAQTSPDDFWDDDEFDMELSQFRGLVLDLTYRPINVVCWRRALCLDILEKADVLEYYDQVINSPGKAFLIPAVLRITDYVHTPKFKKVKMALTRKNLLLRDKYKCQYCKSHDNLTVDHVVPVSRGGGWRWDNLVTACSRCNLKKGDKTLVEAKMELIRPPKEPKELDGKEMPSSYAAYRTLSGSRSLPDQWLDYLSQKPPRI